jgi:alkane 1-monooxygenase
MIAALSLLAFLGFFTLAPLFWAQVGLPWATLVVTFVVIPLLDAAIGPPRRNVFAATSPRLARWVPRAQLPLQALLLGGAVLLAPTMDAAALPALALAVGTVSGGIGITVAHELGHRPGRLDRAIAVALLAGVFYAHFQVEHIRGHHVRVATPQDPATAPRGMNVYRFIARSIVLGFLHACRLEAIRLAAQGRSPWSPGNVVLAGTFASLLLAVLAYVAGGMPGLALFVGQAIWAVALLEIINYVEHYGLRRARVGARYEPVSVVHSWNADFAISNWLLLNLQLHSDHHAHMNRAYEQLRCMPQAPQLPAGYPTMVLAALLPPLWFRLMDRRLPAAATAA